MEELISGKTIEDAFHRRGRKPSEKKLPNLRSDIRNIVDPYSQADPRVSARSMMEFLLGVMRSILGTMRSLRKKESEIIFI